MADRFIKGGRKVIRPTEQSSPSLKHRPKPLFPLIRHLSARTTPMLLKTALTANQVTFISMVLGLAAAGLFAQGDVKTQLLGSLVFFASYLLDHCDGEIARAKKQSSKTGQMFDSFVDWVVHAAFFVGLGWGVAASTGQEFWLWFGISGGAGASINYFLGLYAVIKQSDGAENGDPDNYDHPDTWKQALIFAFRELARADFWLLVIILTVFDLLWILLPAAAFGAHAYWFLYLFAWNKNYRV